VQSLLLLDLTPKTGYTISVMKAKIHPDYMVTKVHCNGTFETRSTVPEITVEICSNCHPFYTGKQKLVDTAGRVDKFKARQAAAAKLKGAAKPKAERTHDEKLSNTEVLEQVEANTVEAPAEATESTESAEN
jgi:large subunit ribosomal protein L31